MNAFAHDLSKSLGILVAKQSRDCTREKLAEKIVNVEK